MISLYSVFGQDSDTVRYSRGFHSFVLQCIPFQQKLYIAFLAKRRDGRSKQNLQNTEVFSSAAIPAVSLFYSQSRVAIPGQTIV